MMLFSLGPYLALGSWLMSKLWGYQDPHEWLDRATRPWALLILITLTVTAYVNITFTIGNAILGHILLVPVDFTELCGGVDFLVCLFAFVLHD